MSIEKQEIPLRGHDESIKSLNEGNSIELLDFLRKFDTFLDVYLNYIFRGTFPTIQNDLMANVLLP